MFSWLARIAFACWEPVSRYARMNKDNNNSGNNELEEDSSSLRDSLLWCRDLEKHSYGDFSYAVVQANEIIEDHSQVETGKDATFVGVYDGHGGPDASRFISDHLFQNLIRFARADGTISEDTLKSAFSATEDEFLTLVSRSIGDAYLKRPEFSLDPSFPRFHLSEPIRRPVLAAEPSLCTRVLQSSDKFLIFASDGLWEHLTNQQAVEIVYKYPRAGIARRLIKTALSEAARKREMRYDDLKKVDKGIRRFFHDDIMVVVIFIDPESSSTKMSVPELSLMGISRHYRTIKLQHSLRLDDSNQ